MTTYTSIDARILRLKVLAIDAAEITATRSLTPQEAEDLNEILNEVHRLHVVVSTQRKQLDRRKTRHQEAPGRTKSHGHGPQHQAKTRKRNP